VFRIQIREVLGLPDPFIRGTAPIRIRILPCDQAKIVKKTLISTALWLYDFLSVKNDVNLLQKVKKNKKIRTKNFVAILKVTDEKSKIRIR